MKKRKNINDATYLMNLGTQSAAEYAPTIREDAERLGAKFPLDSLNAKLLLDNTIMGLERTGRLNWKTAGERRAVFTDAWYREMIRLGIL